LQGGLEDITAHVIDVDEDFYGWDALRRRPRPDARCEEDDGARRVTARATRSGDPDEAGGMVHEREEPQPTRGWGSSRR